MAIKTYVLLDALDVDAQVYQQTAGGGRSQIKKIPWHRPYLDLMVEDTEGITKRLRYKSHSKNIFADEQIEKEKIDANDKFTDIERNENYFRHGILTTAKIRLQDHLDIHPENEASKYTSDSVRKKTFKELNLTEESKIKNSDLKKRVQAAAKIMAIETLEEAQGLMLRINGSFFEAPKELEECQNQLIEWLDQADDEGIENLMKDEKKFTADDKTKILIGKLLNNKLLIFSVDSNKIFKKDKAGKEIEVREIFADTMEERERLFSNFLDTEEGKALRSDLEKDLADFEIKKKQDSKNTKT